MIEVPDFLPLGSVVRLKGNSKKLVVVGRALVLNRDDASKEYYDYSFSMYPEGIVGEAVLYSNHDCIEEVLHKGYADDDDTKLVQLFNEVLPLMDVPRGNPQPIGEW